MANEMNLPKSLEFDRILERLAEKTVSAPGTEAAKKVLPECTREAARLSMEKTMEAETLLNKRPGYPVRAFSNIEAELKRLKTGASLSCGELLRVAGVFRAAKTAGPLAKPAKDENAKLIPEMARALTYDGVALKRISDCILSEDEVADDASPELARIRRAMRKENESIREKLQSMIRSQSESPALSMRKARQAQRSLWSRHASSNRTTVSANWRAKKPARSRVSLRNSHLCCIHTKRSCGRILKY